MSDGPYRSLPLSSAWKRVGKEIAQEASSLDDACEQLNAAIAQDFRDQGADEAIRLIRSAHSDGAQSRLFHDQDQVLLKAQELCARTPINDAIFRHFELARAQSRSVEGAIKEAIGQAGIEACDAGLNAVREHWQACSSKGEIRQSETDYVERRVTEVGKKYAQSNLTEYLYEHDGSIPRTAMRRPSADRLEEGPPL